MNNNQHQSVLSKPARPVMAVLAGSLLLATLGTVFAGAVDTLPEDARFFVAPNGHDGWSGTLPEPSTDGLDGPFASLARARDAVREWKVQRPDEDITVLIRGGRYHLAATVVFGVEDSGSPGRCITYAAYPGEEPVFSAGAEIGGWRKLDSPWMDLPERAHGNVWVTELPKEINRFLVLFDGDRMLPRARGPGFLPTKRATYKSEPGSGNVSDAGDRWQLRHIDFPDGAMKNWPRLEDVELRVMPNYYSMNILPLAGVDEQTKVATLAIEATAPPSGLGPSGGGWQQWKETMWVENVVDYLDEPGEWVLDSKNRQLYLWPLHDVPGDDIVAPRLRELLRVEGSIDYDGPVDQPVRNLLFRGLTFTHGDRYAKDPAWKGWGVQHDWELFDRDTALVRFRGAEDCAVEECRFYNSGGTALRLDLHCQRISIARNLIHHVGQMGILLCGYGPGTKDVNRNNRIVSNHIHHCGEIRWDGHAIFVWQSGSNQIAHNLIHHCPRKAIGISGVRNPSFDRRRLNPESSRTIRWDELPPSVSEGHYWRRVIPFLHARDNVVEGNEIYRVNEKLGDGAAVNVSGAGEGNVIRRNYIHHLFNTDSVAAIRTDGWQSGTLITENILYKCALQGVQLKNLNHIENNIMVDTRRSCITFDQFPEDEAVRGARIRHNIFYDSRSEARFYQHSPRLFPDINAPSASLADQNLFYAATNPAWSEKYLQELRKEGIERHSVAADPLFVDAANGDFRLKADSPAFSVVFKPFSTSDIGLLPEMPEHFAHRGTGESMDDFEPWRSGTRPTTFPEIDGSRD